MNYYDWYYYYYCLFCLSVFVQENYLFIDHIQSYKHIDGNNLKVVLSYIRKRDMKQEFLRRP